ncbi:MAG: exodeoxyribonuclease VII small subunit [Candidatus Saccharimonas sp.]|nr:exodeoxyribonuclease VII small subunit [Candidatus Saccharimonas sp.]
MSQNTKTIEEKMIELDTLVTWFDSDDFSLEKALETYKKAEALSTEIEKELDEYKNEIVVLKKKFDQD